MSTYLQYKGAVLATGSKRGQGEETAEVEEVFFFFNSTWKSKISAIKSANKFEASENGDLLRGGGRWRALWSGVATHADHSCPYKSHFLTELGI